MAPPALHSALRPLWLLKASEVAKRALSANAARAFTAGSGSLAVAGRAAELVTDAYKGDLTVEKVARSATLAASGWAGAEGGASRHHVWPRWHAKRCHAWRHWRLLARRAVVSISKSPHHAFTASEGAHVHRIHPSVCRVSSPSRQGPRSQRYAQVCGRIDFCCFRGVQYGCTRDLLFGVRWTLYPVFSGRKAANGEFPPSALIRL